MIASLLLSIAMTVTGPADPCPGAERSAESCRMVTGYGFYSPPQAYSGGLVTVAYRSQDEDRSFTIWSADPIFHEADPGTPLGAREAHGREVRTCMSHWPRRYTLLGGMPPADFAMIVAAAPPRRPDRPLTALEALVARGLGSESSVTREAAHGCLVRAGASAIEPCLGGLKSDDIEVRHRCRLILDEIRNGPLW
jgi:hypothetical protein